MATLDFHNASLENNSWATGIAAGAFEITGNAGGTAQYDSGASHPVRSMLVVTAGSDVYINIGAAATSTAVFFIPANTVVPLPFDDTKLLYVQSSLNAVLYVLPRN
jgi:hypothetical protein